MRYLIKVESFSCLRLRNHFLMVIFPKPTKQDQERNFNMDVVLKMTYEPNNQTNIQKGGNFKPFQEAKTKNRPRTP